MRKVALLLASVAMAQIAAAQVTLTGTSYTQDFDNIGSGLPVGWEVYTGATSTAVGTAATLTTAVSAWNGSTAGFKNYASYDGLTSSSATTAQDASTDRVLGARQTAAVGDPGAAFVLKIANTTGMSSFNMSFKLQSLDVAITRAATWVVDYGFGTTPSSFSAAAATGTLTTGNSTFASNTINVNFANLLDNQAGPVWIRVVVLTATTGSGSRPTTGLDDVSLNWTNGGAPNYKPVITALNPADNANNAAAGANLQVTFNRNINIGTGSIRIKNVTDQTTLTKTLPSADVTVSGYTATIANAGLAVGKSYHVTFDSTTFDTASYKSYGIYDTTQWNFTVPAPTALSPVATSFIPNDNASGIAPGSILSVGFNRNITNSGSGNIIVKNLTDATSQTIPASSPGIVVVNRIGYITNATLQFGKNYAVQIDSQVFDTAGYRFAGIYNDTTWNFSTNQPVASVTVLNEKFDNTCVPDGWQKYSVTGVQEWYCVGTTNRYMNINGYSGGNNANEDYLISPKIQPATGTSSAILFFRVNSTFAGSNVKALFSTNYTGSGNPTAATWTDLNIAFTSNDSAKWVTKTGNITASAATPFYVAFKYTSTTSDGKRIYIDSVMTQNVMSVFGASNATLPLTVIGQATGSNIDIAFTAAHTGKMNLVVLDLAGRQVYAETINALSGNQRRSISGLSLNSGMYLIKLSDDQQFGIAKVIVQ